MSAMVIHGGDAVAELKPAAVLCPQTAVRPSVIHGGDAVAELKPSRCPPTPRSACRHPRRRRCGRIEAMSTTRQFLLDANVIHGGDAVAELKRGGRVQEGVQLSPSSTAATLWPN